MKTAASCTSLFFALAALAGCIGESPPSTQPGPGPSAQSPAAIWAAVQEAVAGLPCEVATVGAGTSDNLRRLANLSFDGGTHGELDIRGRLGLVARFGSGGLEAVNLTDPLHPVLEGSFTEMEGGLDVKFSPDGMTALVGNVEGIVLVDIRDPVEPVPVGRWKFPGVGLLQNAHMLYTAEIAGAPWVFLAPNSNTGVWILKLEGPPEARTLKLVTQTLPVQGGPLGPHDMFVQLDPDLGRWLLYSSDGFLGWTVFDVTDPTRPQLLGGLPRPETGYTHTIQAAKIGDRRLVATIQEVGANFLEVYDATNLRAPVLLGVWQADPGAGSADAQHNFNIVQGRLYLAHYGHGFYVFDLKTLGTAPLLGTLDLRPVAHYAPGGSFWDVLVQDGLVYGSHMGNGLHVIGDGCLAPGDPALTSTG